MSREPIATYSDAWYETRNTYIGASEAAAACGVSEERQPLDVFLEKTRQREPFEGNDYTRRGHRFEPFLAQEFTARTDAELEGDGMTYFHPEYDFIGASPDRRFKSDPLHLVELKCCNWRRAQQLGPEGSDEVFDDWAMQAQQQMAVTGAHTTRVFVMVDLHTYRHYIVERNDRLIESLIQQEKELWRRIVELDPPEPNFNHANTLELMRALYAESNVYSRELSATAVDVWLEYQRLGDQARKIEKERDKLKARVLAAIGDAGLGVFPSGSRGIAKKLVPIAGHVRKPTVSLRLIETEIKHG